MIAYLFIFLLFGLSVHNSYFLPPFHILSLRLQDSTVKGLDDIVRTKEYFANRKSISELPNDFIDAIQRASTKTMDCILSGRSNYCRIDFDTTIGDQTFTSLKNTLPVAKELIKEFSNLLNLNNPIKPSNESESEFEEPKFTKEGTIRLFFPDMGAAALARRDWKLGSPDTDVPQCVETANIKNDPLLQTDKLAVILCPLFSEAEFVKRVMNLCEGQKIPCLIINPELFNMDQGFGVRARNLKINVLNKFVPTYKLKTLKKGATVMEWPAEYTVWIEDATKEGGYEKLQSFVNDPTFEEIDELFDAKDPNNPNNPTNKNAVLNTVSEVVGFFKGLSRL